MKLEFYVNVSDPRKAVKVIGEAIHTVNNAAIYRECSLMTPEFLIDYSASVAACNYLYAGVTIEGTTYGAYYFIKDRIVMPGGRMVIICAKDVLSTWWHRLKDCTANVIRQENMGESMIIDKFVQAKARTKVYAEDFHDNCFSSDPGGHCYLLTVIGGIHTIPPTPPERKGINYNEK